MILVDLQIAEDLADTEFVPVQQDFEKWAGAALSKQNNDSELTIRVVSEEEISELNQTYRAKSGPTNVLSFPFEMPDFGFDEELGESQLDEFEKMDIPLLGDLVICAAVVNREALEQKKPFDAHWAHMVIHGVLHLLGYDHIQKIEAEAMETLEITLLSELGYSTPY
ncbi:MAG TPA: rRNA maturation RNase YbeY [Ectothiorhodospiraceae bacterium]|nr:rRNA maturation RNase YbeY [Ectothiorhodospiraceae bacterium]